MVNCELGAAGVRWLMAARRYCGLAAAVIPSDSTVIPAQAGIQSPGGWGVSVMRGVDSRFRGNDEMGGGNDGVGAGMTTMRAGVVMVAGRE